MPMITWLRKVVGLELESRQSDSQLALLVLFSTAFRIRAIIAKMTKNIDP